MDQSLTKLWTRVVAGDADGWELLVRRYNSLVIAAARVHGLAVADLEDCAQQTWLALYNGRRQIRDPMKIPTWLVRVAKRRAQGIQIKNKSRLAAEEQHDPGEKIASPEDLYLQTLEAARIHTALEYLEPRCRILLGKLFLSAEDWSYPEIARDLGLAANSLGPIRSRCLARLRKILEELDPELY